MRHDHERHAAVAVAAVVEATEAAAVDTAVAVAVDTAVVAAAAVAIEVAIEADATNRFTSA
jgi:hypothetical protein